MISNNCNSLKSESFSIPTSTRSTITKINETQSSKAISGESFKNKLSKWAIETNQTASSTNKLLEILRENNKQLPKDSRTLKKTPRRLDIFDVPGHTGAKFLRIGFHRQLLIFCRENNFDGKLNC